MSVCESSAPSPWTSNKRRSVGSGLFKICISQLGPNRSHGPKSLRNSGPNEIGYAARSLCLLTGLRTETATCAFFRYIRGIHTEVLHPFWAKHSWFVLNIERCYRWWHHVIRCEVLGFKLRCKWGPCSSGLLRSVWWCLFTDVLDSLSSPRKINCLILGDGADRLSRNVGEQPTTHVVIRSETSLNLLFRFSLKKIAPPLCLLVWFQDKYAKSHASRHGCSLLKRLLHLPAVGRNFESLFCRWFKCRMSVFHSRVIFKGSLAYIQTVFQKPSLSR